MKAIAILLLICISLIPLQAQSSSCTTPNGEMAQCVSIYSCSILLDALKLNVGKPNNSEVLKFFRESQCGYDRNPLVCCGSTDSFNITQPVLLSDRNNLIPNITTCGIQNILDRIINGPISWLEGLPWMALLQYKLKSGAGSKFACGGVLISQRYVLTARNERNLVRKLKMYNVRLGEGNIETSTDCEDCGLFIFCSDAPLDLAVEEIIPHPDYSETASNRYHDIALIRLERDIQFTGFIRPICLPISREIEVTENKKLMVAGWGITENGETSSVKLKSNVSLVTSSQCSNIFISANITLENSQLCAGGEGSNVSCVGDSGGPLMNAIFNNFGERWYVEGIAAFEAQCGNTTLPGIYAKVTDYLKWIQDSIRA